MAAVACGASGYGGWPASSSRCPPWAAQRPRLSQQIALPSTRDAPLFEAGRPRGAVPLVARLVPGRRSRWSADGPRLGRVASTSTSRQSLQEDSAAQAAAFSSAIGACATRRQWEQALNLFMGWRRLGLKPNYESYSSTIEACEQEQQWQWASLLLKMRAEEQQESGHGSWQLPGAEGAEDATKTGASGSAAAGRGLRDVQMGGSDGRAEQEWQEALLLLAKLGRQEGQLSTDQYAKGLRACARTGSWKRAFAFLAGMDRGRMETPASAYADAIRACAAACQWLAALQLLRRLRGRGVASLRDLSQFTEAYNAAVCACRRSGQWQWTISLLSQMRRAGPEPDRETFYQAIRTCESKGQSRWALRLLRDMKECGLVPDVTVYNAVLHVCEKQQQWRRVLDTLNDMRSSGVPPNAETFGIAVRSCSQGDAWARAMALLMESWERGCAPEEPRTYTAAIEASAKRGNWEYATWVIAELSGRGQQPDARALEIAAQLCQDAGQWVLAEKIGQMSAGDAVEQTEKRPVPARWRLDPELQERLDWGL